MKRERNTKNLILGAGLSGLSTAYFLKDDDFLILEKEQTVGGYCRTIPNDRYVWDYAGHFYHFKNPRYKELFLSLVDEKELVSQVKNTKIFYHDKLINYPFQTHIHELEKQEFLECLRDVYFKDKDAEYSNFLEMLYAKFGASITEKFLKPYNEKLYATDLNALDKDAMGRFFPFAEFDDIMLAIKNQEKSTYNDKFLYLKRGTGYFVDRLAEQIDSAKIMLGTTIEEISLEDKTVTTADEVIHYENLINSIPFNQFGDLLKKKPREFPNKLSCNKVLVFNLGFNKKSEKFNKEHWVYFPETDLNFYRIGFYDNILQSDELSTYVEIGFKQQGKIDIDVELQKTLAGMKKVGIIDDSFELVDHVALVMDPAYVHISQDKDASVTEILKDLEAQRVFCLGRYGRWTYNSMEDCIGLAEDLVLNKLAEA